MPVIDCQTSSNLKPIDRVDLLRRFVQAYWLRPENALWMALRSEVLASVPFGPRSADLSCGDGVFMFLHLGGRFAADFDVFSSVASLDRVHADHADMFDHVDDSFAPAIVGAPAATVAVGTDLKPALLAKADRLGLYQELVHCDNNERLPFEDASLDTIYCNSAYWVQHIDSFLRELARIVAADGTVMLHVKLDSIRQFTLESYRDMLGSRFLEIIGRGRFDTWPSLMSQTRWEEAFRRAGLSIARRTPFVFGSHAHIWDIGLRPLAPLLVRMTRSLDPKTRTEIKRDWVDLICELLAPLRAASLNLDDDTSVPVEIQYELKRA